MSAKIFIGSVLVSILILAPATYFLMPVLYPNIITEVVDETGLLLQSKYILFDTEARIWDHELTFKMMGVNGTSCLIQTQGNSSLTILFTGVATMSLNAAWREKSEYVVDLVVDGVVNKSINHAYHDFGPAIGGYRILSYAIVINLDTGILSAGTYNISLYWRSTVDAIGTNSFYFYSPGNEYHRSLLIKEIYQG